MQQPDLKSNMSEKDWIESESIRSLMKLRSRMPWFSMVMTLLMALQLIGQINLLLIGVWLFVSLVVLAFRRHGKVLFNERYQNTDLLTQRAFVDKFSLIWALNAFTWGMSGWLFFVDIPIQNQYIVASMLSLVGFVAVHNLSVHRLVASQFIHIFMGTQVIGALWYIGYVGKFHGPLIQYIHLLSLGLLWGLLKIFDNRFYSTFARNLSLQFRNATLINSLSLKNSQLEHEKHVAINATEVLQRFYASAANEIKQPVSALKLFADTANSDPAQLPILLPKISDSCSAITHLFDTLFEFEKINSGHVNVAHQIVDIDELIDDLEYQFKPSARQKKLEFRTNTVSGFVQTDELLIKRILTCFISNAIKFTEQGGILVAVRKRQSMVVFEIWDTGIGIDTEDLEHVFEQFYKVGNFSSTDEGFGLGLSVVKRLAEYAEGSTISVNAKLGQGSVFRFALPIKLYTPPYIQSRFEHLKTLPLVVDYDIS